MDRPRRQKSVQHTDRAKSHTREVFSSSPEAAGMVIFVHSAGEKLRFFPGAAPDPLQIMPDTNLPQKTAGPSILQIELLMVQSS